MERLGGPTGPTSSLYLQLLIWVDDKITRLLVLVVLVLLVIKPYYLNYPRGVAVGEFIFILLHLPVQGIRNWFGTAGNKQERASFLCIFLLCTVWTALVTGYFWKQQAFALKIECGLSAAALAMAALETLLASVIGAGFSDTALEVLGIILSFFLALGALLVAFLLFGDGY